MSLFYSAGLIDAIPASGLDHFYWSQSLESVSTWPDAEGNNDATANGSPTLDSNGINNEQAVGYDGSDDDHLTGSPWALGAGDVYTFVAVFELRSTSGIQTIFSNGSASGNLGGYRFLADGSTEWEIGHTGVTNQAGGTPDQNPHVVVGTYDGSSVVVDLDGSEIINASISAPTSPNSQMAFAQRGDDAEFSDVLIGAVGHEASAADAARRDELTGLLAEPFGISTST